jgi:hypothetical protein
MGLVAASCQQGKPVHHPSEVETIFTYILQHDYPENPVKDIPFAIATQFSLYPDEKREDNRDHHKYRLLHAMRLQNEPDVRKRLNADCLTTPNTSAEIDSLRQKVARLRQGVVGRRRNGADPVLLAFSSSCATADGRRYYYVELTVKREHYASGDLYILHNGVVERTINIWIT